MRRKYVPPPLRESTHNTSNSIPTSRRSCHIARQRLARDLVELQRANILSIAAHPIENDIFEWHVNIKPTDGVYSGVYFHLVMIFPESYPSNPPQVKICTPIRHPNIFNDFLCLSMLRSYTGNIPYEGWSGAYSVTSILMQLQSFLFAEKIDQDGGYQVNAALSDRDVQMSIQICKTFQCGKCTHSHSNPWPKVKASAPTLIKICSTEPESRLGKQFVTVQGCACQTTYTYWLGVKAEFACSSNHIKVMYEAFINWTGDKWSKHNARGGLCRFGFGSKPASICGCDAESFGYGGTGMFSYDNNFDKFGESFGKEDTIAVALDFDTYRIYFAKNGQLMDPKYALYVPENLKGKELFPLVAFKNSRVEFNFGVPKKPCCFLMQHGFKTLEQIAALQTVDQDDIKHNVSDIDWHSQYIIPELWVCIFEGLSFEEIFSVQFVCEKWYSLIHKYNLMERNEIYCYFSKVKFTTDNKELFGIGLSIRGSNIGGVGLAIHSQWDILSLNSWNDGCRSGVWGEDLTHFLPLVLNKNHAKLAHFSIQCHLQKLSKMFCTVRRSNCNELERDINRTYCLKLVDTLVTMMNLIVTQFVLGNENINSHATSVSMVMCEKVVLGYCTLHHLLLYLVSQNKETITAFANKSVSLFVDDKNGCHQNITRDLGKFVIYLMISTRYGWNDIAQLFVEEVATRNVLWMVNDMKYLKYDTTNIVAGRLEDTFISSLVSNRLVMFQVWFMKNNACETLHGYNQRLGRPNIDIKNAIFDKTKFILKIKSWCNYFNELGVIIEDNAAIDQLLRFAVFQSQQKGYHRPNMALLVNGINAPKIGVPNCKIAVLDSNRLAVSEKEINLNWRNKNNKQQPKSQQNTSTIQNQSRQQRISKSKRRKLRKKKNVNKANKNSVNCKWVSSIRPSPMSKPKRNKFK